MVYSCMHVYVCVCVVCIFYLRSRWKQKVAKFPLANTKVSRYNSYVLESVAVQH